MAVTRTRKDQLDESEGYKEFTYDGDGTLQQVVLYESAAKVAVRWTKNFSYSAEGVLETVTVVFPDETVVKTFSSTGGVLTSVQS